MKRLDLKGMSVPALIARFAEIGVAQDEALLDENIPEFNRLYRLMDDVDNELRDRGDSARLELLKLYDHPNMQVQLKAVVRSLAVAPARGRSKLKEIADSLHYPQAGDAGMLLNGLDDGSFKPT